MPARARGGAEAIRSAPPPWWARGGERRHHALWRESGEGKSATEWRKTALGRWAAAESAGRSCHTCCVWCKVARPARGRNKGRGEACQLPPCVVGEAQLATILRARRLARAMRSAARATAGSSDALVGQRSGACAPHKLATATRPLWRALSPDGRSPAGREGICRRSSAKVAPEWSTGGCIFKWPRRPSRGLPFGG